MILVSQLTKRFGNLTAVDSVSFTVESGEAVALWGANGAGKTTAVRCLLGLLHYQGEVSIAGLDATRQGKAVRRLTGFVPQELNFHDDLTVAETLTFYARLKKVTPGYDFTPLLARLELAPHVHKPIRDLSGGLKQRLALSLALLAEPPILILDEPTANLDIRSREDFIQMLHALKGAGKTLIFSSHRLDEVMSLADRVLLMEAGKLVVDAPPRELERRLGRQTTLYLYLSEKGIEPALQTLTEYGMPVSRNGRGLRVRVAADRKIEALNVLHRAGVIVDDFTVE